MILLIPFVLADIDVNTDDFTVEIDYRNLEDDDDFIEFSGHQIVLTNTGDSEEEVTLELVNLKSDYENFIISPSSFTLAASESKSVLLSGEIPFDEDEGINSNVASLKVSTLTDEEIYQISTDVQPMLEITKIYVYVNGQREFTVNGNDDNIDELKPGDEIELHFRLENFFDEDYNHGDMEGEIQIQLDNNDFGDEIDEEISFDIEPGEEIKNEADEIVLSFEIPKDAEKDDYILEIKVDAEDDNGASYEIDWELTIEVDRENDDIRIEELTLTPGEISCERRIEIITEIVNYGTNNQRHAALKLYSPDLNIDQLYEFELDKSGDDDEITKKFTTLINSDVTTDIYDIIVTTLYDYNTVSDEKVVNLFVRDCVLEEPVEEEEEQEEVDETSETEDTSDLISSANVVDTVEKSYGRDNLLLGVMITGIVLMLVIIVLLIIALNKK